MLLHQLACLRKYPPHLPPVNVVRILKKKAWRTVDRQCKPLVIRCNLVSVCSEKRNLLHTEWGCNQLCNHCWADAPALDHHCFWFHWWAFVLLVVGEKNNALLWRDEMRAEGNCHGFPILFFSSIIPCMCRLQKKWIYCSVTPDAPGRLWYSSRSIIFFVLSSVHLWFYVQFSISFGTIAPKLAPPNRWKLLS